MKLQVRCLLVLAIFGVVAEQGQNSSKHGAPAQRATLDPSGMYTFLHEGEFVQVNLGDGRITGFVSRYGDLESDKGAFLDHFFSKGSYQDGKLAFTTRPVHGVWFDFRGSVHRGDGKSPAEEGYLVVTGTLTQYTRDINKKVSGRSREVEFKSFPEDKD